MNKQLVRVSSTAFGVIAFLACSSAALAECRAPAACIACHANIPNSPPPAVLTAMAPATCQLGDFTRGLNMTMPRFIHRTAKLNDGRVLLTGGETANAPAAVITNSVDAFNPADNSVAPVAPMTIRRWSHAATTLADGRVLVTGGRTGATAATGIVLRTAEIYDPATDSWTETTGPMNVARRSHTSTLLPNGKVLIAGGGNGVVTTTSLPIQSAELFDPATGLFTLIGNMVQPRSSHSALLLKDGTVLISGGSNGAGTMFPTNTAEIYSPADNSFMPVGPMNYSHLAQLPGRLRDGRVVQGSSYYNNSHTSAGGVITKESEIYDPLAQTFTPIAPMFKQRIDIGAQGLLDGTLLIAGGVTTSPSFPSIFQPTSEVYDPASSSWKLSGIMSTGRDEFSGLLLDDGRVVISGGFVSPGAVLLKSVEVYSPGLTPQINGLYNVVADYPNSAFKPGGRQKINDFISQVQQKVAIPDLGQALDKTLKLQSQIIDKVADPAARLRLLSITQVLINTLNDKISPNVLPTVAPVAAPPSGVEPLTVAFTGNIADSDGSVASILWTFTDGATSNVANPSHVFQCDGIYQVTLEAVDNRGGVGSATVPVSVSSAGGPVTYGCDVQPVFSRTCTGCHGSAGHVTLTTCENLKASNDFHGDLIIPGDKEASELWVRINSTTEPMPPIGGLLPLADRNAIGAWIDSLDPLDTNFCD